jgi:outer membrane protein
MKHRWFIVGALLVAMTTAGVARADVRLAYVDIQRALNECRAGRAAKVKFRGRVQRLQTQLESEQKSVELIKQEIETKGPLMQPDQRQTLEDEYAKKLRRFQDDYKNSRDELQQRDSEITGAIVRDLAMVVRQVGEKDGYTMIMEKGSLLWAVPSIDITDQVIRAYDAMNVQPGSLSQKASATGSERFGATSEHNLGSSATSGRSTITK